jgi:hypothetical protein
VEGEQTSPTTISVTKNLSIVRVCLRERLYSQLRSVKSTCLIESHRSFGDIDRVSVRIFLSNCMARLLVTHQWTLDLCQPRHLTIGPVQCSQSIRAGIASPKPPGRPYRPLVEFPLRCILRCCWRMKVEVACIEVRRQG